MYDLNNADQQMGDTIPAGTIAPVTMLIRPGGSGEDGQLKQSNSSDAQYLDCEFTVTEGPFARRKFWQNFVISGGKKDDKGRSIAGSISLATLRAALESARNIKPNDFSEAAMQGRRVASWADFNGLTFLVKIGIEKDKTGQYEDKNKVLSVITPDKKQYANGPVNWSGGGQGQGGGAPAGGGNQWASPAPTAQPAGGGQGWQGQNNPAPPAAPAQGTPASPPPVANQAPNTPAAPTAPMPPAPGTAAQPQGPAGSAMPEWAKNANTAEDDIPF